MTWGPPPPPRRRTAEAKAPKTTSRAWKRDARGRWLSRNLVVVKAIRTAIEHLQQQVDEFAGQVADL